LYYVLNVFVFQSQKMEGIAKKREKKEETTE
jgi:hypothetical protein